MGSPEMGGRSGPVVSPSSGMTKRYEESIEVTTDPEDAPVAFSWRGRRYEVDRRLGSWREGGEWWNGGGRERECHRVLARPAGVLASGDLDPDGFLVTVGAVYDVYRERARGGWKLARVWD